MKRLKAGDNLLIIVDKLDDVDSVKIEKENVNVTYMIASEINSTDITASFDYVVYKRTFKTLPSNDFLSKVLSIQKPGSIFAICDIDDNFSKIEYGLKVNGHINIMKSEDGFIYCNKPNYEIGSSAKLNLKAKPAKAVWKIDDTVEDDMIDPDNLLDEDDLKKPDMSSLKVCATTGKRKACKDCSCGLAEELAGERKGPATTENAKSSCGSCYLGDAFRCATCPYLGMPAFKPGEKVQLAGNMLKSDI